MANRISFVLLLFFCSIPFGVLNMFPFFAEKLSGLLPLAVSIIAVVLLFITGLALGYNGQTFFIRWYLGYWAAGLLVLFIGHLTNSLLIVLPYSFVYYFPFSGLQYFLHISSEITLALVLALIAIALGIFGYYLGIYQYRKKHSPFPRNKEL